MTKEYHYVVVARTDDDGKARFYIDFDTTFAHFEEGIVYDTEAENWYWPRDEDPMWDDVGETLENAMRKINAD